MYDNDLNLYMQTIDCLLYWTIEKVKSNVPEVIISAPYFCLSRCACLLEMTPAFRKETGSEKVLNGED